MSILNASMLLTLVVVPMFYIVLFVLILKLIACLHHHEKVGMPVPAIALTKKQWDVMSPILLGALPKMGISEHSRTKLCMHRRSIVALVSCICGTTNTFPIQMLDLPKRSHET